MKLALFMAAFIIILVGAEFIYDLIKNNLKQ